MVRMIRDVAKVVKGSIKSITEIFVSEFIDLNQMVNFFLLSKKYIFTLTVCFHILNINQYIFAQSTLFRLFLGFSHQVNRRPPFLIKSICTFIKHLIYLLLLTHKVTFQPQIDRLKHFFILAFLHFDISLHISGQYCLSLSLYFGFKFVFFLILLLNPYTLWKQLGVVRKYYFSFGFINLFLEFFFVFLRNNVLFYMFLTKNRGSRSHEGSLHHAWLLKVAQKRSVVSLDGLGVYLER